MPQSSKLLERKEDGVRIFAWPIAKRPTASWKMLFAGFQKVQDAPSIKVDLRILGGMLP